MLDMIEKFHQFLLQELNGDRCLGLCTGGLHDRFYGIDYHFIIVIVHDNG